MEITDNAKEIFGLERSKFICDTLIRLRERDKAGENVTAIHDVFLGILMAGAMVAQAIEKKDLSG